MRKWLLCAALLLIASPASAMKMDILKGTTCSNTTPRTCLVDIFIQDSSSAVGAGLAGLTNASANLVCYVARSDDGNAAGTQLSLSGGTRGTWTSGGFIQKDSTNMVGIYELGLPTTAVAVGSNYAVVVCSGATNMAPMVLEVQLVAYNPQDSASLGLTKVVSDTQFYLGTAAAPAPDNGTLAAGSATGGTLAATAGTNVASLFLGGLFYATGGTIPSPRWCTISAYTSGRVFTCARPWSVVPDGTTTYTILVNAPTPGGVILKNVGSQTYPIYMVLASDHISVATGKTVTVNVSKDGAAFGAITGTVAEVASGWYLVSLSQADTNCNACAYFATAAATDTRPFYFVTTP